MQILFQTVSMIVKRHLPEFRDEKNDKPEWGCLQLLIDGDWQNIDINKPSEDSNAEGETIRHFINRRLGFESSVILVVHPIPMGAWIFANVARRNQRGEQDAAPQIRPRWWVERLDWRRERGRSE